MSLRLRRGPSTDRISIVFQAGELVYDTTEKKLYVGDDLTQGGIPVGDLLGDLSPQLGSNLDLNGEDIIGFGNINIDGDITATGTLTIPNIVTDITGSIFGDDSTPLVDGANSKLVLENNNLSDLGDVTAPTQDKQFLEWNSLTNTWDPKNFNLNDYIFNSEEGSYLRFNGTSWVASYLNDNINSQNGRILVNAETEVLYLGEASLGDIGDVFLPGAIDHGSILKYNSTTENWEADSNALVGNLNDLDDVSNNAVPTLGDILTWDGIEWTFAQPKETTNVVGSVFGDDSTILVDGIQNRINLSNNSLSDLNDVELYNTPAVGNILRWNGFRWQPTSDLQDFQGDFQGSVFGDDSSIIVSGIDNSISTGLIKIANSNNNGSLTIQSQDGFEFPKIAFEVTSGTGSWHTYRNEETALGPNDEVHIAQYGSWITDPTGTNLKSMILTTNKSMLLFQGPVNSNTGIHDEIQSLTLTQNKVGIGTYTPIETLHTMGSISATEYIKFGSYDNTARNALSAANPTAYGMVIYNTDSNVFEGYQNTGGTTPEWVALS